MKTIFVRFQREGIHQYNAAGFKDELVDVSFLRYPHRHIFHFEVQIEVQHDDREIEFILFKRELEALYGNDTLNLNHKSCEMIADELSKYIREKYGNRWMMIEVSEDNENGARCYYERIET